MERILEAWQVLERTCTRSNGALSSWSSITGMLGVREDIKVKSDVLAEIEALRSRFLPRIIPFDACRKHASMDCYTFWNMLDVQGDGILDVEELCISPRWRETSAAVGSLEARSDALRGFE